VAQDAACLFDRRRPFLFTAAEGHRYAPQKEWNIQAIPAALMFNHVLSIAAFGFVAFVLMFMHPASHAAREAAQHSAQQEAAARIPPQLAASP
jgi:hypothetical protein